MPNQPKIWYSFMGGRSEEDHISFYNPKDFDWVAELEQSWEVIADEIAEYLAINEEKIKPYFNKSLVTEKSRWRTSSFFFWTWRVKKNMQQCPKTMGILKKIPGVLSASISILESETEIKPHRGDTNAIIRAHFPLKAPIKLPECGFKVNEEERSWEEGKLLLFNDAAKHTAWNHSQQRRYVLLFDVIRPEFISKKFHVSSLVLSGLLMQTFVQKLPFLNFFPIFFLGTILYSIAFFLNPLLRAQSINR